jgi:hypothetical protein
MSFMSDMLKHLNRMVMWRLNRIRPTANEAIKMDNAGISADDTLRAFIAWRRTNMLLAVPITFASAVMATVDTGNLFSDKTYMELWNALGKVTFLLPSVAALVLFIAVGASSFWWTNWRRTRLLIRVGWSLSFLLAFIPALFPVNSLLTEYWLDYYTTNDPASLQAEKIRRALVYIMVVLPLVVTFPGGAVRAAVRIRGLLPEYVQHHPFPTCLPCVRHCLKSPAHISQVCLVELDSGYFGTVLFTSDPHGVCGGDPIAGQPDFGCWLGSTHFEPVDVRRIPKVVRLVRHRRRGEAR